MNRIVSIGVVALVCLLGARPAVAGPSVAAGTNHTVVLTDGGLVWAWGQNSQGQLGDGTMTGRAVPTPVTTISGVTAIAAGSSSTYALKSDHTVWAWGSNGSGQLGDGTFTVRPSPVAVSGLTNVIAIAAGRNHALALKSDGTVWAWGGNSYGQIGDGTMNTRPTPVQVTAVGTTVQSIGAGGDHSHVSKADGTVWSWGYNGSGDLGDGSNTTRTSPVQTSNVTAATHVEGGAESGFSWDLAGALKAWGYNGYGGLGDGTWTQRNSPVSASGFTNSLQVRGSWHTVAAKTDGTVWTWGMNYYGQLGNNTTSSLPTTLPAQVIGLDSVVSVAAGDNFSIVVSGDGRVWTWGQNNYNQLGDGTIAQRNGPVQISDAGFAWHVAMPAVTPAGGTYNNSLTVGVTCATLGATIHYTTNGVDPVDTDPTIASGGLITISQTTTLKAKAWLSGMPPSGVSTSLYTMSVATPTFSHGPGTWTSALNVSITSSTSGSTIRYTTDGSTPTVNSALYTGPIPVNTRTTVKAIGFKSNFTDSAVASVDYSFNYGTLAAPTFTPTPSQVGYASQVTLTAASFATIRYTTNGSTPTTSSAIYSGPITVTGTTTIYAKAFHIDWTASPQSGGVYTVKVGTPVFSPDAGSYAPGQLVTVTDATPNVVIHYTTNGADPTATDPIVASGATVVAGNYTLKARGFVTGWTTSDAKTAAYTLTGPFTPYAASLGQNHAIALKNDGTVWTWGNDDYGQLGDSLGNRTTAAAVNGVTGIVSVAAGTCHTLALRADGAVLSWGCNTNGQLGDNTNTPRATFTTVTGLTSVTAIAAGASSSVVLKSDGTVWAWGSNASGQLGDGTIIQKNLPTQVTGLTNVVAISAGDSHVLARKSDGTVWAWGDNTYSQLGDGTPTRRLSPVQLAGLTASAGPWAGYSHSFAVTSGGSLYAWGDNGNGQLGTGGGNASTPVLVSSLTNVTAVDATGYLFTIARTADGSAWMWGFNGSGQLGDGTTNPRATPYPVAGVSDVVAVAAGQGQSLIITSDGSAWDWGSNASGELGDGTLDQRVMPRRISEANFAWKTSTPRLSPSTGTYSALTNVMLTAVTPAAEIHYTTNGVDPTQADATVASGGSVLIDQTGVLKATAWAGGMPVSNVAAATYTMVLPSPAMSVPTGTYTATQTVTITCAVAAATIRYTTDGTVPTAASLVYSAPITVDATTTVVAKAFRSGWMDSSATSRLFTLKVVAPALTPAGGSYGASQTVTISTTTPSTTIRYALNGAEPTSASPVYTSPIIVSATTTVKAVASRSGWLDSDSGAASFWITQGSASTPTFLPVAGSYPAPVDVRMVTTTSGASIRYTLDGTEPTLTSPLYQWPIAVAASTGIKAKAFKDGSAPSVTGTATYALDMAGAVDTPLIAPAGGWFASGPIATVTVQASGATVRYTTSGADPVDTDPIVPSGGITVDRSMVVKVKAWSGSATPSAVRRADFVVTGAISASEYTSHALKADGTVWSWGDNGYGAVGDATNTPRPTPVVVPGLTSVVAIASSTFHTLAVKSDGSVWSWGRNDYNQLGDSSGGRNSPAQVAGLTHIIAVAAGRMHSVALRDDGTVWTWGGNGTGQLGDGTTTMRATPAMIAGLSGVTRIAAGYDDSFAIEGQGAVGGRLWAWGNNASGQLGDGTHLSRKAPVEVSALSNVIAIAGGDTMGIAATADGAVWTWGYNGTGQLGDNSTSDWLTPVQVPTLTGAVAVAAGRLHATAITDDGHVWTWGNEGWHQLGEVNGVDRHYPLFVAGLLGDLALSAGPLHTMVVEPGGGVKAWGSNGWNELGDGTTIPRDQPMPVSGLSLVTNTWLTGDQDADGLPTWRDTCSAPIR